ncbi:hypothetical protein [Arsenicicoccus piscis]|uniref:Uncharacterized protein n=1 Tax=Arsenicicoccus piscis TaxID=673954 RepID=A0ABQ6HMA5_9MICO|nr:hypothetical protein [Arsenicicoccus piscis]GMA18803.1 hypothetical protein GCM10025862_08240 [Arsenicicoccus piscis]
MHRRCGLRGSPTRASRGPARLLRLLSGDLALGGLRRGVGLPTGLGAGGSIRTGLLGGLLGWLLILGGGGLLGGGLLGGLLRRLLGGLARRALGGRLLRAGLLRVGTRLGIRPRVQRGVR